MKKRALAVMLAGAMVLGHRQVCGLHPILQIRKKEN